jgi:hypothetical protein
MWTRLVFKNVETMFVPTPSKGFDRLDEHELLPVYMTKGEKALMLNFENDLAKTCSESSVVTKTTVEKLCVYCKNSIKCSIGQRGEKMTFVPDIKTLSVLDTKNKIWRTQPLIDKIKTTLEIPFIATLPFLKERINGGKTFEIETLMDLRNISFDRTLLVNNLVLIIDNFETLHSRYETLRKFESDVTEFVHKIGNLLAMLRNMTDEEYAEKISNLLKI